MSLGTNLQFLRREHNWSGAEAARQLDTVYSTYMGYEKEEREPGHDFLIKAASIYGVTTDYLLGLADFALRAVGDSMTGAGIDEKDLVFVRKQPSVENGELAVVLINGEEAAVKRVYKYDTYITLNAENPAYAPLVFHEGDSSQVEILGKVVAHLHYYKEHKNVRD